MFQAIFLVPIFAVATFLVVGNDNRKICMLTLPLVSIIWIWLMGGTSSAISALMLSLTFFVFKEVSKYLERATIKWIGLAVGVSVFLFLKDYFGFGSNITSQISLLDFSSLLNTLGLSFIVFRGVEYLLSNRTGGGINGQSQPGMFERVGMYAGFSLAYPSVTSGPILRWKGFRQDYASSQSIFANKDEMQRSIGKIASGLMVVSLLAQPMFLLVLGFTEVLSRIEILDYDSLAFLLCASIFYLHFLYLNFSGYSDVMIGSGKFIGLNVPENFDKPFSSNNFLEFWGHWHLSVSHWFRDIVFSPIVKFFVIKGIKSNTLCSAIAYVVTFGLLGLWHGRTWPFLLCGAMLAIGALFNQLYRDFSDATTNDESETTILSRISRFSIRSFVYLYISISILGLWLPEAQMGIFWSQILSYKILIVGAPVVLVYAALLLMTDSYGGAVLHYTRLGTLFAVSTNWWINSLKLSIAITSWFFLSLGGGSSFVYEGF